MQYFRIPSSICEDIEKLCAGFWWGDKEEKMRIHWRKWADMCKTKEVGGLGFRNLQLFNKALLAKQVWRMLRNPNSLVARVFQARYFKNGNIMEAKIKSNASFVWRSLLWSRELVEKGMIWSVGDGECIRVFTDRWVGGLHVGLLVDREGLEGDGAGHGEVEQGREVKVAELVRREGDMSVWNEEKLRAVFVAHEVKAIINTPIGEHGNVDGVRWRLDEKGVFTVKSVYLLVMDQNEGEVNVSGMKRKFWANMVWSLSVPPKVKVFIWRAYSNLIPTEGNLKDHHVPADGICGMCWDRWSTTEHCLLFCPKVRGVWKRSRFWVVMKKAKFLQTVEVGEAMREQMGIEDYEVCVLMLWKIWSGICRVKHDETATLPEELETENVALWDSF